MGIGKEYNKKTNAPKNVHEATRNMNNVNEVITSNEKFMNKVKLWTSFYRKYPFMFCKDFLQINLKPFQKILLYMMFNYNFFMFLAARGLGKSWLVSVFCICKCMLFSKLKVVIASGNLKQATQIIKYIDEMRQENECLARSISYLSDKPNNAQVQFFNGSKITVVASNAGARSGRANVLIVDEFILVDKDTINKVLRKFKANPRTPGYLSNPKYAHMQERNQEIYMSSAGAKWHWSYTKFKSFFNSMMNGKKYFLCDLPYQLTIKDGLRMREEVLDEMSEEDFDPIGWEVEMEGIWLGESDRAFFKFDDLNQNRSVSSALYPKSFYSEYKDKDFKYEEKKPNEIRIVSCDISGMNSAKNNNDASVYTITSLIPCKNAQSYDKYVRYIESQEGGHAQTQALRIRYLFDQFDCDYIVIDTHSFGLGVYDQLCMNLYDSEKSKSYEAFSCKNDEIMAQRCLVDDAPKVIYSVKATPQLNSEMHIIVRDNLKRGKLKLLIDENVCKTYLNYYKFYGKLSAQEQFELELPFLQTTFLVNEMVSLEKVDTESNYIKLKEPSTKRKDHYSSLGYMMWIAKQLELQLKKETEDDSQLVWY